MGPIDFRAYLWVLLAMLQVAARATAQDAALVDELDQKLSTPDGASHFTDYHQTDPKSLAPPITTVPVTTLKGELAPARDLETLTAQLEKITTNIAILDAQVQQEQQTLANELHLDSLVAIDATIVAPESLQLQSMQIRMDGYLLHSQTLSTQWLAAQTQRIYYGPLVASTHRLDITARLVQEVPAVAQKDAKPHQAHKAYHKVNKSFEIVIPKGTYRQLWRLSLAPPPAGQGDVSVKLQAEPLPS